MIQIVKVIFTDGTAWRTFAEVNEPRIDKHYAIRRARVMWGFLHIDSPMRPEPDVRAVVRWEQKAVPMVLT